MRAGARQLQAALAQTALKNVIHRRRTQRPQRSPESQKDLAPFCGRASPLQVIQQEIARLIAERELERVRRLALANA